MTDGEMLYQRFQASAQQPVRLQLALQGFFLEEIGEMPRQEFANYLRLRIRPAAEALIRAEDLPKLQALEKMGWLHSGLVEECLEMAARLGKTQAFIWLLGVKAEKYGFSDRIFEL